MNQGPGVLLCPLQGVSLVLILPKIVSGAQANLCTYQGRKPKVKGHRAKGIHPGCISNLYRVSEGLSCPFCLYITSCTLANDKH